MALMFPRLARNFVKAGYFPTDAPTLERVLSALSPANGLMKIIDPCAGEGVAIAETAHALGRGQVEAFAVEYDAERAAHARQLVDHCLHGDLMTRKPCRSCNTAACWCSSSRATCSTPNSPAGSPVITPMCAPFARSPRPTSRW
jgi:hypothetical protein